MPRQNSHHYSVKKLPLLVAGLCSVLGIFFISPSALAADTIAGKNTTHCTPSSGVFFGFTPWYAYLTNNFYNNPDDGGKCDFYANFNAVCNDPNKSGWTPTEATACQGDNSANSVGVNEKGLDVVWLVGLAIFEDLLRFGGMVSVGFVIYGGIRYVTSQGEPNNVKAARDTILYALGGLAITVIAAGAVSFIGSSLG